MPKPKLPETLPELAAVSEEDTSGLQPIQAAWDDVFAEMRRAFAALDYARAVDLGERFVEKNPDHASARLFLQECRTLLEHRLERELMPLDRVVYARVKLAELTKSRVEPRMAFLLAQVDGQTTIEDLVDLAGMPRVDALRTLADAISRGLVALR